MTLIQASIWNNKKSVILIGDRLVSVGIGGVEYETEGAFSKLMVIDKYAIGFAGNSADISIIKNEMDNVKHYNSIISFVKELSIVMKNIITRKRSEYIQRELSITLDEFHEKPFNIFPENAKEYLYLHFTNIALDVSGLIIGFHNEEAKIFKIDSYGDYEEYSGFGYTSVGSGHSLSEIYFDQHDYMPHLNIAEGLHFAYRAKKSAEFNTGVGNKTDIVLITSDGKVLEIIEESDKMQKLKKLHQDGTVEIKKVRDNISEKINKEVLEL